MTARHVLLWKPTPEHPAEVREAVMRYREMQLAGTCSTCGLQASGDPRQLQGHAPTCGATDRVFRALAVNDLKIEDLAWEVVHVEEEVRH